MNEVRIAIYADGRHELGKRREYAATENLPALPRLVHRLLGQPSNARYACEPFRKVRAVHGKGLTNEQKAKGAILRANQTRCRACVIVIDRDRKPNSQTLAPLARGRDMMQFKPLPPCAVGVGVEAFDAWMILDGKAIRSAEGDPAQSHPNPESLNGKESSGRHPKDVAASIFGSKKGLGQKYAVVAMHVDVELLRKHCPQGFAPFAAEVEDRIRPVVAAR